MTDSEVYYPNVSTKFGTPIRQKCDVCGKMVNVFAFKFELNISEDLPQYQECVDELEPFHVNRSYGICFKCLYEKWGVTP